MREVLRQVDAAIEAGKYAAGIVSYNAAPAFDSALNSLQVDGEPLASFHIFESKPTFFKELDWGPNNQEPLPTWMPDNDFGTFSDRFAKIKSLISQGATYQVNFTFRLHADREADVQNLFARLVAEDPPPYASFFRSAHVSIASLSPEQFFKLENNLVECRPMKGTASRGTTKEQNDTNAESLRNSEKNRAENLMVVDMIRNDLGKIAEVGSVITPTLFEVEAFPTLLQMTSTVEARVEGGVNSLFGALFPCASVVGAPKSATMREIGRLESSPRGFYTGAIGWAAPGPRASFSVAIRTITAFSKDERLTYGIGSGIVWDSKCEEEWQECLLKAKALQGDSEPWGLLETMRWTPGEGFWLLDAHLDRLAGSAKDLGVPLDRGRVLQELDSNSLEFREPMRIRLVCAKTGDIKIESYRLGASLLELRARVALNPVSSKDPALRYKTNRRSFYNRHARVSGLDEALLWNERGEATEFCNGNLVVRLNGKLLTPPVDCGLLNGTLRSELLRTGEVQEAKVYLQDLSAADAIYRINSVRGWQRVILEGDLTFPIDLSASSD